MKYKFLILIGVVLAGVLVWRASCACGKPKDFTVEDALVLMENELSQKCEPAGVDDSYKTCTFKLENKSLIGFWSHPEMLITYQGYPDDSVYATQYKAKFKWSDESRWQLSKFEGPFYSCQEGRGHQYFSSKLCS